MLIHHYCSSKNISYYYNNKLQQQQEQSIIIAIAIFALVYFLIIFGRRRFDIPIWSSMLIGAAVMVGFQIIDIHSAFRSINLDLIGFLFGMFSIVSTLD